MRRTIPRSPPDMQTSLWAFCVSWKAVAWTTPLGSLSTLAPHQPQSFADLQIGGGMQVVAAHQFAHVVAVEAARDGIQGVAAADGVVPGGFVLRLARRRIGRRDLRGRCRKLRGLQLVGQRNPLSAGARALVRGLQEPGQVEAGALRLN